MNSETGMALQGEDFESNIVSLRGLFVTRSMGGGSSYPGERAARRAHQRLPGCNQSRAIRHHSRL